MPTRITATVDPVSGNVITIASSIIERGAFPALAANTYDITAHPDRALIESGDRRWNGSAWVALSRTVVQPPQIGTLTDRQLLERIAISMGVARP